jgi:hypothetical protein
MSKQTAVEWLYELSKERELDKFDLEQAKYMEKQQNVDFARHCLNKAKDLDILTSFINVQQYYNETYK